MDWKLKILLGAGIAYAGATLFMSVKKHNSCKQFASNVKPMPNVDVKPIECKFKLELNPLKW